MLTCRLVWIMLEVPQNYGLLILCYARTLQAHFTGIVSVISFASRSYKGLALVI